MLREQRAQVLRSKGVCRVVELLGGGKGRAPGPFDSTAFLSGYNGEGGQESQISREFVED